MCVGLVICVFQYFFKFIHDLRYRSNGSIFTPLLRKDLRQLYRNFYNIVPFIVIYEHTI